MRIQFQNKRGRKKDELNDEEREWLIEFLDRSDTSYTTPGRKDHVYVGKIKGEKQYQQKRYLLWKLRDLHEIANGTTVISLEWVIRTLF